MNAVMNGPASGSNLRIGVASRAHVHADGFVGQLAATPGVEVVVSDPDGPTAGDRGPAGLPAGVRYVGSYDELFAADLDGVLVTTENSGHRALIEQAADAGIAVLSEKPLATTAADARAIAAAVRRAGVPFMIAYPVRFMSATRELGARIASGQLGEPVAIRGTNNGKLPVERPWFVDPVQAGGGALFDHIVHVADLVDAWTGARPVRVSAVTNQILHTDITGSGAVGAGIARAETAGLVLVSYDSGLVAAIDCSWSHPLSAPTWGGLTVNVTGSLGDAYVDPFRPRLRGLDAVTGRPLERTYGDAGNARLIAAFLELVRTGEPAQPGLDVALRTLSIVLAAAESAATGRTVEVDPLID